MDKLRINIDSNLYLRSWTLEDAQELFDLVQKNKKYLVEWLPWAESANTFEDTKKFIELAIKQYKEGPGLELGIIYENKIAGSIGMHAIDKLHNKTSIGYWLDESCQGKGIMTKSVKALINYCFDELDLNRVQITAAVGNEKSNAIPVKLGFIKEGVMREAEKLERGYMDWNLYSILKRDWKKHE